MTDVARAAHVSVQTVSNYVNGRLYKLSPGTQQRVQGAIDKLDYRVNQAARGLRSARTNTLCFLVMDENARYLSDPLTAQYIAGVGDVAREYGYSVLIQGMRRDASTADFLGLVRERRPDAACALLSGHPQQRREVALELADSGLPCVLFDEINLGIADNMMSVRADQELGAKRLTQYLIGRGHQRIGFIAARTAWAVVEQRVAGYRQALAAAGLRADPRLALFEAGYEPSDSGQMVAKLMALNDSPTAIMCGSDLLAIGAIRYLFDQGIRVPEDIAVCGFDDFDFAAHTEPPLTTVTVPAWAMGSAAAQMLLQSVENRPVSSRHVCLPTELRIRGSA